MKCSRCQKETKTHSMSYLNTDEICMECKEEEKGHPLYEKAKKIELEHVKRGEYNYKGMFYGKTWAEIKTIKG